MNTEQIIKAMECCFSNGSCDGCPYTERVDCRRELERNALALIKEQQKELTYCYDKLTELERECLGLSLHNINLKNENKYLRERLKEEAEIKEDMKGK